MQPTPQKKVWIQTFGCQMNDDDTAKMYRLLSKHAYEKVDSPDEADLILLNTCSIREKPEQKVFSSLGRIKEHKERRQEVVIGVGGCMAQLMGDKIVKRAPYVDLVFGTYTIHKLPQMLHDVEERRAHGLKRAQDRSVVQTGKLVADDFDFLPLSHQDFAHYREDVNRRLGALPVTQHVTIQNGCNKNCSYCIVPTVRGREISRDFDEIVQEVELLVDHGVKEVTLVGQTVNSYGKGEARDFADLLHRLNEVDGLARIRFVTSHPRDLHLKLIETMASCEKVCNHLHLPIQSGSNRILRQMYRGYTYEKYLEKITLLRKLIPDIGLSSDIIVGFPGEEDVDFEATMRAIDEIRFDSLFSFIYSERPFTKAADMPNMIPLELSRERLMRLQERQNNITKSYLEAEQGKEVEILVESDVSSFDKATEGRNLRGRSPKNRLVHVNGPERLIGEVITVTIDRVLSHSLQGVLNEHKSLGLINRLGH